MMTFRRHLAIVGSVAVAAACAGGSDSGSSTELTGTDVSTTIDAPATTLDGEARPDTTTTPDTPDTTTTLPSPLIGGPESFMLDPTTVGLNASRAGNDGLLPAQESLDLFAAVYGQVPGADAARFEAGPRDGTMAARDVFRVWSELAPDQQNAVIDLLGLDDPAGPPQGGADGEPEGLRSVRSSLTRQTEDQIRLVVESIRDEIAALLGVELSLRLDIHFRSSYPVSGEAIAFGRGSPFTEPFDTCRLILRNPPVSGDSWTTTIAHEVFHCFQYASPGDSGSVPQWIIEGQAQWVGARIGGADADVLETFRNWLGGLRSPLFGKSYDAIGFYYAIEQAGVNPWEVMLGMLGRSNTDAVTATGLGGADAVRWMGTTSGHADLSPSLPVSEIWQIAAPEPNDSVREQVTVTEDSPYTHNTNLPAYSAAGAWVFALEEELATVQFISTSGAFEFFGKTAASYGGSYTGEFCLRPEGCDCGTETEPTLMEGSDKLIVAIGSLSGSTPESVSVQVEDLDDGGFADGHWQGTLSATPITTTIADELVTRGDPTAAPFEFDVIDGAVTGTYSVAMAQTVDGPDLHAEGVGTISGAVTGCWLSPNLDPVGFSFRGTATIGGQTVPFDLDVPFDGAGTGLGSFSGSFTSWRFDVAEEDVASGSLPNGIFLEFMRSVGVNVNDVEVTFAATRTTAAD